MKYVGEKHTHDTLDIVKKVNQTITSKKSTSKLVGYKRIMALVVIISMLLLLSVIVFDVAFTPETE